MIYLLNLKVQAHKILMLESQIWYSYQCPHCGRKSSEVIDKIDRHINTSIHEQIQPISVSCSDCTGVFEAYAMIQKPHETYFGKLHMLEEK